MMGSTKLLMKFIKENHLLFNIILLTFIIFCAPLPKEVNSNEKLNSRFFNINEIESLIKLYNFAPYHEKYNNYSKTLVGTPYVNNVLIGSKKDIICNKIALGFKKAVNLAGKTDLRLAVSIISNATKVIGSDTGLVHAAEALGKKVIMIMRVMITKKKNV